MKKKLLFFSLALALMLSVFAIGTFAEADEPTLKIEAANLEFADNVYLWYAVSHDGIDAEDVELLFFTEPKENFTLENADYRGILIDSGATVLNMENCAIFKNAELRAKNMADNIYAIAYANVDGEEYYSAPVKYSILQYAYNKLGKTGTASENEAFKSMLTGMLSYGADAQIYFEHNTNRLADGEFYQVIVTGGTISDGFERGLYQNGDAASLSAPAEKDGKAFSSWKNEAGEIVSTDAITTITVHKNEVYTAFYGETFNPSLYSEGLNFTSNGDGTCYVSGIGTCEDEEILIPPISPLGDTVVAIGKQAFANCEIFTDVILPYTVKTIDEKAFYNCDELIEIHIPGTVESIGLYAFADCKRFDTVTFSEGLQTIAGGAFMGCPIKKLEIPNSVTTISTHRYINNGEKFDGAFENCAKLKSVTIGNGVLKIERETFLNCVAMTSLSIGDKVESIGTYAFSGCAELIDISFGQSLLSLGDYAFYGDIELASIDIPSNIQYIGIYCFNGCKRLEEVTFNEGLLQISGGAFMGCPITELKIPNSVTTISTHRYINNGEKFDGAFENCTELQSVTIGDGLLAIERETFLNCNIMTSLSIGESVTSIGEYAFSGCTELIDVALGKNVATLDNYAFYGAAELTSIILPASIQSIGIYCFNGCINLSSVTFNEGLKSIDGGAFMGCPITELEIPNSVTTISTYKYYNSGEKFDGAFENCTELQCVTLGKRLLAIDREAFRNCTNLTTIIIGNRVESIGISAFAGCSQLVDVTIGERVITIADYAFHYCSSLPSIVIPESVENIGIYCFNGCTSLSEVTFNEGLLSIAGGAFMGCPITELEIPNSVTTISTYKYYNSGEKFDGTFENCTELQNVTLGNRLLAIDREAFQNCTSLTAVIIGERVESIGISAFAGCSQLVDVTIGQSVIHIADYAFQFCSALPSILIPSNVQSIGIYCFNRCTSLSKVTFNEGLLSIAGGAFMGCPLTELEIPNSVTTISSHKYYNSGEKFDGAFENCSELTSVTLGNQLLKIERETFRNCANLTSIVIGERIESIREYAFNGCSSLTDVYYNRAIDSEAAITITEGNDSIVAATTYYYSEEAPTEEGNFWHYDENGKIAIW